MAKIKFKDCINRSYFDKKCVKFSYILSDEDNNFGLEITFKRDIRVNENLWTMDIIIPNDEIAESQLYHITYQMPKSNMSMELIATTGLKLWQTYLKSEIQAKSLIDITIGDL